MSEIDLGLSHTTPRATFKKNSGQNNHFLITILIGIDAVLDGKAELKSEFSTSWNPYDVSRSALRSREYALTTSLSWITDLVDVYRKEMQKIPSLLSGQQISTIEASDGRSNKLAEFASSLNLPAEDCDLRFFQLAIKWRNIIAHSDSKGKIEGRLRKDLISHSLDIADRYCGLDIDRSINSFEHRQAPTFKEVTSFIAAGQRLVASIDAATINSLDIEAYAESLLSEYFSKAIKRNPQTFGKFWTANPQKSCQRLTRLLLQLGFTQENPTRPLRVEFLENISRLTPREARLRYLP